MALSPWPASPVALANATATLKAVVGPGLEDSRVQALGAVAAALVERYAATAPQSVKDEAVIRAAGYLAQSDFGGIASETVGPRSVTWTVNHAALFRNSGAAALLSPWRVRRAGAIAGT